MRELAYSICQNGRRVAKWCLDAIGLVRCDAVSNRIFSITPDFVWKILYTMEMKIRPKSSQLAAQPMPDKYEFNF